MIVSTTTRRVLSLSSSLLLKRHQQPSSSSIIFGNSIIAATTNNNNNIIERKMSSSSSKGKAPFSYNTYDSLPDVPIFKLTSTDIEDGKMMPKPQLSKAFGVDGGEDISPQLSWDGFDIDTTKSFVVSCYDPDAPVVSGFWHWIVYDIPVSCTSLDTDAGNATDKSNLPDGAKVLKNDAGFAGFLGSAPPPGHGEHRYIFCVSALPVENLPIDEETTSPAVCHFNMFGCGVLGRAFLTTKFGR